MDLHSARIHQRLVLKVHYIITPAHKAHKSFLKPSQLPGEYTAQLLPFQCIYICRAHQRQQPTTNFALTGTHLLLGGEKQLW